MGYNTNAKECLTVWVFNGEKSSFPAGIFSSKEKAEAWIEQNELTGVLTEYPIDEGTYDWSVKHEFFNPRREDQKPPLFKGRFTSARQQHFHYRDGQVAASMSPLMEDYIPPVESKYVIKLLEPRINDPVLHLLYDALKAHNNYSLRSALNKADNLAYIYSRRRINLETQGFKLFGAKESLRTLELMGDEMVVSVYFDQLGIFGRPFMRGLLFLNEELSEIIGVFLFSDTDLLERYLH